MNTLQGKVRDIDVATNISFLCFSDGYCRQPKHVPGFVCNMKSRLGCVYLHCLLYCKHDGDESP